MVARRKLADQPADRPPQTILFIHQSDDLYGSDRCLLAIVQALPDRYRAIVVLPADIPKGALSRALRDANVDVRRLNMAVLRRAALRPSALPRLGWQFLTGTWQIARLIRRERITLVHSNTLAVVCGAFAALVTRRPHIWHLHEVIADEPPIIRGTYRLLLSALPTRIIANSRATAAAAVAGSARRGSKVTVIYNGIALPDEPPSRVNGHAGPVQIGTVGRLAARKGIAEALLAAAILRDRGVAFRLTIIGSAPSGQEWRAAEYRRLRDDLDLENHVTFEGFVDDVGTRLAEIDILLVPSQRPESFGLAAVEGMAAGCAVVAARTGGGSDELLIDGVTGLYSGHDPRSIADTLSHLIADRSLRNALQRNAPPAAAARFGIARYIRDMLDCYDRATGVRSSRNLGDM